jgi:hypothetical protein
MGEIGLILIDLIIIMAAISLFCALLMLLFKYLHKITDWYWDWKFRKKLEKQINEYRKRKSLD